MTTEPRLNPKPRNQIGAQSIRPARGTRDGQLYISDTGLSGWDAEAGVWRTAPVGPSGGAPSTEIPFGNVAGGFDFSAHFTFDEVTGIFTVKDTSGAVLFQVNGTTGQITYGGGARLAQRDIGAGTTAGLVTDYIVSFTSGAVSAYQAIAMGAIAGKRVPLIFQDTSFASAYGVALANPHTIHCLAGKKLNNIVDGTAQITTGGGTASFVVDENDNMFQLGGA